MSQFTKLLNSYGQTTLVVLIFCYGATAQSAYKQNTVNILPALSYAQETGFRFGANLIIFRNLSGDDTTSRMSKFLISAFGTTKDQYFTNNAWQIFSNKEKWLSNGSIQSGYWNDRLYNSTPELSKSPSEIVGNSIFPNYKEFNYFYANLNFTVERKIAKHTYLGLSYEFDYAANTEYTAEDSINIPLTPQLLNNNSRRSGIGLVFTRDTRDNADNPTHGSVIQVNIATYKKFFGGTVNYDIITLEMDKYVAFKNRQVLALRVVNEFRNPEAGYEIPFRGLSYNGGITSLRGYFTGTFRANNLLAFETEYRLPFFNYVDGNESLLKFWKRMGVVTFLSGVKTSDTLGSLYNSDTKWFFAGGAGVRYMLDTKQRVNICFDYAVGLTRLAGDAGNNSGFYIGLSEAF